MAITLRYHIAAPINEEYIAEQIYSKLNSYDPLYSVSHGQHELEVNLLTIDYIPDIEVILEELKIKTFSVIIQEK